MKFALAATALIAASASAFAPATGQRSSTALNQAVDRRVAFGQIAAGAAAVAAFPKISSADGAVSKNTVLRSKFKYGGRIYDLKAAVEKGDLAAVAAEKNAFILYNSGAYPTAKDKALKKNAIALTNEIFAAIKKSDAASLKTAYGKYIASNGITAPPVVDANKGQGYSGDFDYKARTKAGTIYVR